jgi:transposase
MEYWAKAPVKREQTVLFAPTLDASVGEEHPVRLFDELLASCDWSDWERAYHGGRGQPPIHPRVLAGAILYGLSRGIRSSRKLEYATSHNIDFIWLVEGRTIDHSTFCTFRKRFRRELKSLFRDIAQLAMRMGLIRLGEVGLDGTRAKANNSRRATLTAATLKERLASLAGQIEQMFQEAEEADRKDQQLFDTSESSRKLPPELADAKKRQQQLKKALEAVEAADESRRRKKGIDAQENPAQAPTTDPDCKVLPNKEGGYAPNYTPMAATDGHRGFIVQTDVLTDSSEHATTVPTVEQIEKDFGERPSKLLADGAHATGQNIVALEEQGVDFYSPVQTDQPQDGNPAKREDFTQAVPESEWSKLPRNPRTKNLDRSAFVYVPEKDEYYCPMGQSLPYEKTKYPDRLGGRVKSRVYRCHDHQGCPLAKDCLAKTAKHGRTVSRDEYQEDRERLAAKMSSDEAQGVYRRRLHIAETPFAVIKHIMNLRQFLLRGLENVKTEWLWACTAFNLKKLAREIARLRAHFRNLQEAVGV